MKRARATLAVTMFVFCFLGVANQAKAAPFTPDFSDYPFPGSQFTVDAAANAFFGTNYGINISNAYLYVDSRDTFDGIGVSTGEVSEIGSTQTGRITFLDSTDFVTIDWWTIQPTTYQAFAANDTQLDTTLSVGGSEEGTRTFNGGGTAIAYLTWTSGGGFGQISGLSYNYDGTTDGRNTDLPGAPTPIPEPGTLSLIGFSLLGLHRARRKART